MNKIKHEALFKINLKRITNYGLKNKKRGKRPILLEGIKESIVQRIQIGTYVPGQRLYISALAEEYNVSTMEIRTILRILLYERVLFCTFEGEITVRENRMTPLYRLDFYNFYCRAIEETDEMKWAQIRIQEEMKSILFQMLELLKKGDYTKYHQAKIGILMILLTDANRFDQEMVEQELRRWCYFHPAFYEDNLSMLEQDYAQYVYIFEKFIQNDKKAILHHLKDIFIEKVK